MSTYAPAVPGVLVALAGLFIAHRLTQRRDRRKELLELCEDVQKAAEGAAESAVAAWLAPVGMDRTKAIADAKKKIQLLGIMTTLLKRRAARKRWAFARPPVQTKTIDVITHVSALRRAATSDPFEDPARAPSDAQIDAIMLEEGKIHYEVTSQFSKIWP